MSPLAWFFIALGLVVGFILYQTIKIGADAERSDESPINSDDDWDF